MRYVLDTNIIIAYLRSHPLTRLIDDTYAIFSSQNDVFISVVTVGELCSLALQNSWGVKRLTLLAYSQGRLTANPLPGSARNMSKNDLWIAASASVLSATLLTLDQDFDHLHNQYVTVICLNQRDYSA